MVEGVDRYGVVAVDGVEDGVVLYINRMGRLAAVGVLAVLDGGFRLDVLLHSTAKSHGQRLYSTADTEHGYLPVVGQTGDQQFGKVALAVDGVQLWRGFLAAIEGVEVASAAQEQSVYAAESIDYRIGIGQRGYDDRHTSGLEHGLIVGLGEPVFTLDIVARDAYHGLLRRLGIRCIHAVEALLPIETLHL